MTLRRTAAVEPNQLSPPLRVAAACLPALKLPIFRSFHNRKGRFRATLPPVWCPNRYGRRNC